MTSNPDLSRGAADNSVDRGATVWSARSHVPELDGLRGLAILIVTIYRFARYSPTETTAGFAVAKLVSFGDRGVDLFFVLSGFLITGILLDTRGRAHYLRNFFARRTLRIFPLYFITLVLLLIVLPRFLPENELFLQARERQFFLWTYLTNVRIALEGMWCFGALDHFWSLAVEEHFYLLWPFVVLGLGRGKTLKFALLLALTCSISRISFAALSNNYAAPDVLSGFRFDGLLLGSAIACIGRGKRGLQILQKPAALVLGLSSLAIVLLEIQAGRLLTISHSVWAVFWSCFLISLLNAGQSNCLATFFRTRWLCSLGKYSYAMYVFQSPLIPLLGSLFSVAGIGRWLGVDEHVSLSPLLLYTAGMFAVTYALAILSWNLLEKHCLKLKRFFQ